MKRILLYLLLLTFSGINLHAQQSTEKKKVPKPTEQMVLRANTRDRVMTMRGNTHQIQRQIRHKKAVAGNEKLMQRRMMIHRQQRAMQHRTQREVQRQMFQQRRIQQQQRPGGPRR
jgi:hypothetical protein